MILYVFPNLKSLNIILLKLFCSYSRLNFEDTIKHLKENGKKLVVATSKPEVFARKVLDYCGESVIPTEESTIVPSRSKRKISYILSHISIYLRLLKSLFLYLTSNDFPVISFGCSMPISSLYAQGIMMRSSLILPIQIWWGIRAWRLRP